MNIYEDIKKEVQLGLIGRNNTIPFPIEGLEDFLEIAKNTMTVVGGATGSGKSTFTVEIFITGLIAWYFRNKDKPDFNMKLSIMYFGMERKQVMLTAKMLSRFIFEIEGVSIIPKKILGRTKYKLTEDELALVNKHTEIFKNWHDDDLFMCTEGSKNPTGISKYIEDFAKRHGKIEESKVKGPLEERKYIPNHDNHLVIIITDHLAILKSEKDETGQKKNRLDKFSQTMRLARDLYGYSPVIVQQLNRGISDINRLKLGDIIPKLSDFADTSDTQNDSDVVIALLDPWRVLGNDADEDVMRYKLRQLRDEKGKKYYRSMHILKNTYGTDGISIPLAFHPVFGIFKKMPKIASEMTVEDYHSITSEEYFLS